MESRSSDAKHPPISPAPARAETPAKEPDGRSPKDRDGLEQHRREVEEQRLPEHKSSDGEPAPRPSTPDEELPLLGYENRGAVGFPNPDESLEQQVLVALEAEPSLDYSGLAVSVENGVATLRGTVKSERERALSVRTAEACPGIQRVVNQVRIKQP